MRRFASLTYACILLLTGCVSAPQREAINHAEDLKTADGYTLIGKKDFWRDYTPTDS